VAFEVIRPLSDYVPHQFVAPSKGSGKGHLNQVQQNRHNPFHQSCAVPIGTDHANEPDMSNGYNGIKGQGIEHDATIPQSSRRGHATGSLCPDQSVRFLSHKPIGLGDTLTKISMQAFLALGFTCHTISELHSCSVHLMRTVCLK